jgi:hypothetical protein
VSAREVLFALLFPLMWLGYVLLVLLSVPAELAADALGRLRRRKR